MWKLYIALLLTALGGMFYAGWRYGSGQVIVEKGETITVIRDRIVTRTIIRSPDGTVTETIKEEEHDSNQTDTTVSTKPGPKAQANYRIGAAYWASSVTDVVQPKQARDGVSLSASRRIVGPIWIDVQGRLSGVALGVSVEF